MFFMLQSYKNYLLLPYNKMTEESWHLICIVIPSCLKKKRWLAEKLIKSGKGILASFCHTHTHSQKLIHMHIYIHNTYVLMHTHIYTYAQINQCNFKSNAIQIYIILTRLNIKLHNNHSNIFLIMWIFT